MMDKTTWRLSESTHEFIKAVKEKQREIKDDLCIGSLVVQPNETIVKEYVFNMGILEGLKFLEEYIALENDDDRTVSGENVS